MTLLYGDLTFFQEANTLPQPPSVSYKEERAYFLEHVVKFLYPLAFIIFNIAYWTYYLSFYYEEDRQSEQIDLE